MRKKDRGIDRVISSLLAFALIAGMAGAMALPALADGADAAGTPVNGGFETGDLTGWTLLDGSAADSNDVGVVSDDPTYWETRQIYNHGKYYLRGDSKEGVPGGRIRSSTFTLGGDGYITFMIGAASAETKGSVKVYAVNEGGEDTLVKTYVNTQWKDPERGLTLLRMYDKLTDYMGRELYFVVENGTDTGGFAFINVDDFRASLTLDEVKELHRSEMERILALEDAYKDAAIDAYKAYGLAEADYSELTSTVPETVTRYAGGTVDVAELISSFTKARRVYKGNEVPVEVDIAGITYNGEALPEGTAELTLSEGAYGVTYTLTFDGTTTGEMAFTIEVKPADAAPHDVENGGFETGDLTGWEVLTEGVFSKNEDGSFRGVISDATYWAEKLPYNQEGNYHLDGWTVTGEEGASWGVRSSLFTLAGSGWVSFRMGGNAAQVRIYTENGTLIRAFDQSRFQDINFPFIDRGGSWGDMGTYFVDLSSYKGQSLYLELWDKTMEGGWRVAFFDAVKCYYEDVPDVENGYDTVTAPVDKVDDVLQYGEVRIPWTQLYLPSGSDDVVYLSFDNDTGFTVANAWGWKQSAKLTSVFENPTYQDGPVEPYRPQGVKGKALNFDGYSNSLAYSEVVEGAKLTVDVYVCPRVFCWSAPQDAREDHIPEVIAGSYSTGGKAGFLLGVTKHGYLTFRVGTGNNWYNLVGDGDSVLPTYEWSRVTAVFDGDAGKMYLYLNGEPAGEKDIEAGSRIVSSGDNVLVGRGSEAVMYEVSDKTMFPGLMDELTISMTAKTAQEVAGSGYALPDISYEDAMTPDSALDGDYFRPQYHPVPSGNWMNEPHALFQYKGRWHLFYQFAPAGPYWQTISWGHWVSDDMVSWEFVKEAVIPTENTVTPDAVWTGNMIFDSEGKPLLLITAGDDGRSVNGSNQHVGLVKAVDYDDPDLTEWEILGYARAQEADMGWVGEFRDAQAFGIGDERYMVVGGATGTTDEDKTGVAHVFRTTAKTADEWAEACKDGVHNGMEWEYMGSLMGDFFDTHAYLPEYGKVWEMPNLVPLSCADGTASGKYLFVFSPQYGDNDVWYFIGEFDTRTCRFTPDFAEAKLMDYGDNIFTGPTVYLNSDGKVYICSIMQDGRTVEEHKAAGWAHFAGLPRELFLKEDGTLGIAHIDTTPIEGRTLVSFKGLTAQEANERLKAVDSDRVKIDFELTGGQADEFGFILKKSDGAGSRLYLNGTKLGLDDKSGGYEKGESVRGTIYVDKCSIEAYIDDSIAISGVKYLRGTGLEVFGDAVFSVTVTEMESIHGKEEQPDTPHVPSGPSLPGIPGGPSEPGKPSEPTEPTEPTVSVDDFADVAAGEWYYDAVAEIIERGLMNGVSGSSFAPETNLTRGMLAAILYRASGSPEVSGVSAFEDVESGTYYTDPVTWAAANGIVTGYSETKFGPEDDITREQLAAILWRYAKYRGVDTAAGEDALDSYGDRESVSGWAVEAMRWAVSAGIINGRTPSTLVPGGDASRAEVATMVVRFLRLTENAE